MTDATINLARIPSTVRSMVGRDAQVPSYQQLYHRVVSGTLPAEQRNGRWYLARPEVEAIARESASIDHEWGGSAFRA